ncbi:MAG: efflux RND transporter periplasmic adaptor subunit [Firmicutes bacterium]|nr:efflux RND transporter periplasmic adaptor subunit [Bacillota bacterium]
MKRLTSKLVWILIAAVIVAVAGFRITQQRNSGKVARTEEVAQVVEAIRVGRVTIEERLEMGGNVAPGSEVQVTSKIPGRVVRVLASVGKKVAAGEPLLEIDSAEFASLRAALTQAEINLSDAKLSFQRFDTLYKQQAISRQQWEAAQNRVNLSEAQYRAAKEQLSQAGGVAGGPNGERLVLTAPQAGTVSRAAVDPGNLVSPGAPLVTIVDIRTVFVEIGVPERAVNKVQPGAEVNIRIDAVGITRKGRVDSVGPSPDSRTKAYPVKIEIDNPSEDLKPGMFARVALSLGKKEGVLALPKDCVVERVGRQVVYVVMPGTPSKAQERTVTTGLFNGTMVEIVGGLSDDELVVSSGQHLLADGAPVSVKAPGDKGTTGGGSKAQ